MEKIVTLTLNPAIDKSTTVNSIVPDKKLRCSVPKFEPGGGGVNVSRAIKKLGGSSTAIYLAGGHSGKYFEHLLFAEGINSCVVEIEEQTRENLIVVDNSSNLQYRFIMPGPEVREHEWQQCLNILEKSSGVEYIVASGSLPNGVPEDFFGRLAAIAKKITAKLVVDTSGEPLRHAINEGLFMIKPNMGELSSLKGVEELHAEDAIRAAKEIINRGGCEMMVVSMGASGASLVSKDIVFNCPSPVVKRRSTVGAGDSMVAGMVLGFLRGLPLREVLQYGIAAGTAATMNTGTELCKKEDVEKLFAYLKGEKVEVLVT
ncbi:1-phosphofructokinase family hexose kinase [Segetibacter koreensis]|uniref:1-phosphofructokinase family hexose kinase n=1 Tax=Segetibacter koreensis TaxID=398037 RepID=UPI0003743376|nr:1-phosphofructokinase family hexose kinase [Segetibacter koreensis]